MPNPTPGDLHVSAPLTDISVAYLANPAMQYVASNAFPVVNVSKQGDLFYKFDKGEWFRTDARKRAPGTPTPGVGWNVSTDNYYADVWGLHQDISDQERANADDQFRLDELATIRVTNDLLLRREKDWVSRFFTTSVWDGQGTPSTLWDAANSDPIKDVTAQKYGIAEKTGYMPNTLVVGPRVWQALINHDKILDRVKYTQAGFITQDIVARAFEVDRILVALGTNNTAIEGATTSMNFIAGKHALLCYSNPSPGLNQPSAGYTFSWSGLFGATNGARVKKYYLDELASDRIEAEISYAQKVIGSDLGYFFNGCVS